MAFRVEHFRVVLYFVCIKNVVNLIVMEIFSDHRACYFLMIDSCYQNTVIRGFFCFKQHSTMNRCI